MYLFADGVFDGRRGGHSGGCGKGAGQVKGAGEETRSGDGEEH